MPRHGPTSPLPSALFEIEVCHNLRVTGLSAVGQRSAFVRVGQRTLMTKLEGVRWLAGGHNPTA